MQCDVRQGVRRDNAWSAGTPALPTRPPDQLQTQTSSASPCNISGGRAPKTNEFVDSVKRLKKSAQLLVKHECKNTISPSPRQEQRTRETRRLRLLHQFHANAGSWRHATSVGCTLPTTVCACCFHTTMPDWRAWLL